MPPTRINFIQREEIVTKYKGGTSARALAEEYGCDHTSIYRFLKAAGVERQTQEFDCELADKVREEYESGETTTSLAAKYQTSKQRISRYIKEAGGTIRSRGPLPSS